MAIQKYAIMMIDRFGLSFNGFPVSMYKKGVRGPLCAGIYENAQWYTKQNAELILRTTLSKTEHAFIVDKQTAEQMIRHEEETLPKYSWGDPKIADVLVNLIEKGVRE